MSTFTKGVCGYPRRTLAGSTAFLLAISWLVVGSPTALADGPTTFANSTAIAIPTIGSVGQTGPANPYPSAIAVSGMSGVVSNVTVTFQGLSHGAVNDIDAMVVAPSGDNIVVLSDVGDPNANDPGAQLVTASNINLTFSDAAAGSVPRQFILPSGTFKPTNTGSVDAFPGSAPTPSAETTLAGAFTGIDPNGGWLLYIVDDATGETGAMAGGWSLSITTETTSVATTTTVVTSDSSSTTGAPVTFTATVSAGGVPVTLGTIQFTDGAINIGAPVALNGSGKASLTTAVLSEGTHLIRATYSGVTGFLTSNGTVSQRVDDPTVVTGNTFCNTGGVSLPSVGTAQPYPSNITVSGMSGIITKVTASLKGLSHQAPGDLDVLLTGPTPSTNLFLLSDSGGFNPVSDLNVTFDDAAATAVPIPLVSGTFRPTNADDGSNDAMPAPAPAPSGATALSTFNGASANGRWSLWMVDDASGDAGSISGGWCLTVTTQSATTTTLITAPSPSTFGADVTLTATVSAGGSPVTAGTVQFRDGTTLLGAPVAVGADGRAILTTAGLGVGSHSVNAAYSGAAGLGASSATATQVVAKAPTVTTLTAAPNPSAAGGAVVFTATVKAGGSAVAAGAVQFSDGGVLIGAPVTVGAGGKATLTTSTLAVGSHAIQAAFTGAGGLGDSTATIVHVVTLVTNAGGPYTVAEGGAVTLDASGSTPGQAYSWDVNGDGVFGDASGISPTLTWAGLEALGINDGPATHNVAVKVVDGAVTRTSVATTLVVINTAPAVAISGSLAAKVAQPLTLGLRANDPSSADMAAQFTYTVDWGDGSPVQTVTGPANRSASHTYVNPGLFIVAITATDKDGGRGGPATAQVRVEAAPSPSPSPSASPSVPPTPTPSVTPSATPPSGQTDLYSTPGYHFVNGRRWFTTCEPYSQTVRCRTSIWATQVTYSKGAYHRKTGWYFNNLTYLPYMTRAQWVGNPLGRTGQWTAVDARKWRTECDTPTTGGNGCRSWIRSDFIASRMDARGNRTYYWTRGWVFNNIVRFR